MKTKILLTYSTLFLFILNINAQPLIEWQTTLGGSEPDVARAILQTTDGGYMVAGHTESNDGDISGHHGLADYWVAKLTEMGEMEWSKTLGGSSGDYLRAIQQTTDDGYILAGYSGSNNGNATCNNGAWDFWIVKLSSIGGLEWQQCYGGSSFDEATSIQQTEDDGFIVAGTTYSDDGDVTGFHGQTDIWVVKLSSIGEIEWQKAYGGSSFDEAPSIHLTNDGGYVFVGTSFSDDGDITSDNDNAAYWVVKLSSSGEIEWEKTLGGSSSDYGNDIKQTQDGGYIVIGTINSSDGDITNNHGFNDIWLVKLSETGEIQWQNSLGGSLTDNGRSVQITADNGFIITGRTDSNDGDITNHFGQADYWVAKLNDAGALQWQKTLGGSDIDVSWSIQQTFDNGFIVAGSSQSIDGDLTNNYGGHDFWIVKLAPFVVSTNDISNMPSINLFPNPASTHINIQQPKKRFQRAIYTVYDIIGQAALSGFIDSENTTVDLNNLSNGLYTIEIQTAEEISSSFFLKSSH